MKPLSFFWALLILLAMSPGAHAAQGAAPPQRTYIGQDTCVGCHDTEGTSIHQDRAREEADPRLARG